MKDQYSGRTLPWLDLPLEDLHAVNDPAQARILADPRWARFLIPFLGKAVTVSEAAAEVGSDPNTMLYRVRRMLEANLLEVVERRTRAGRPIKVYRSTHDGWFVPMESMNYLDLRHRVAAQGKGLATRLTDAYTKALARSPHAGRAIGRTPSGEPWTTDLPPVTTPDGRPILFADMEVHLTADEAAAIQQILLTAITQPPSEDQAGVRTRPYLLATVLLPLD